MPFFPTEPRRVPMPPVYRQNFGPPNQMRSQVPPMFNRPQQRPDFFRPYPQHQPMANVNRQPLGFFGPNQQQPFFDPYGRQQQPEFNQQGPFQQQQQQQPSRFGRLPDTLNTLMGHAGTITNGVNMMRQFGSLLSLFR